ncbi:MAG: type II secretion system F family protein [Planctomycetota bacterium]
MMSSTLLGSILAAVAGFLLVLAIANLQRDWVERRELRERLRLIPRGSVRRDTTGLSSRRSDGRRVLRLGRRWRWWRRLREGRLSREQWPAALDWLGRLLRAGLTFPQALELSGAELQEPLRSEFRECHEQQKLGLELSSALEDLATRLAFPETRSLVVAVRVQEETGGNLAELLDRLAIQCRQRRRLEEFVDTFTAESRAQAAVLLVLPLLMVGLLAVINRPYFEELASHRWLIVIATLLLGIGAVWMHLIRRSAKSQTG